jgi:formyl-CoA transferase
MSKSQVEMTASPLLGEHTDEVLREDLGLSPTEIQSLRHGGSIGSELLDRPVR